MYGAIPPHVHACSGFVALSTGTKVFLPRGMKPELKSMGTWNINFVSYISNST